MFVDIPGYEGMYTINECGIIKNDTNHVLKPAIGKEGYQRVSLQNDKTGKRTNYFIHRLVATTFLPNPENYPVVMHMDDDKLNNHVSNLQWGTQSENIQQAFDKGRKVSPRTGSRHDNPYEIFNDKERILCHSRRELADTIEYEMISLKNMVGNGRVIALGPYKGYQIRRLTENPIKPIYEIYN